MESYRNYYSTDVNEKNHGSKISLAGWIEDIRNIGSIAFIIVRDRKGTFQVTCLKKENAEIFEKLVNLPRESVISAETGLILTGRSRFNGRFSYPELSVGFPCMWLQ